MLYCEHGQGLYYRLAGDVKLGIHNVKCSSFNRDPVCIFGGITVDAKFVNPSHL